MIDPHFIRETYIDECVAEAVGAAGQATPAGLADCLASPAVARQYSRLHILVCGYCHAVFHVIDEFRSHTTCCLGAEQLPQAWGAGLASPGLALVLWTDTVLRLARQRVGEVTDHEALVRRIESKWFRLSRRTKLGWERAAEVLLEKERVGRSLFATALERDMQCTERCPGEQWPGPLDFCDADEIHGSECLGDKVKLEAEAESEKCSLVGLLHTNADGEDDEGQHFGNCAIKELPDGTNVHKRSGHLNIARNKRGRWEAPKTESRTFNCDICDFTTATEWKLRRHESSSKHKEKIGCNTFVTGYKDNFENFDDDSNEKTFTQLSTDGSNSKDDGIYNVTDAQSSETCTADDEALINS